MSSEPCPDFIERHFAAVCIDIELGSEGVASFFCVKAQDVHGCKEATYFYLYFTSLCGRDGVDQGFNIVAGFFTVPDLLDDWVDVADCEGHKAF